MAITEKNEEVSEVRKSEETRKLNSKYNCEKEKTTSERKNINLRVGKKAAAVPVWLLLVLFVQGFSCVYSLVLLAFSLLRVAQVYFVLF